MHACTTGTFLTHLVPCSRPMCWWPPEAPGTTWSRLQLPFLITSRWTLERLVTLLCNKHYCHLNSQVTWIHARACSLCGLHLHVEWQQLRVMSLDKLLGLICPKGCTATPTGPEGMGLFIFMLLHSLLGRERGWSLPFLVALVHTLVRSDWLVVMLV